MKWIMHLFISEVKRTTSVSYMYEKFVKTEATFNRVKEN